MPTLAIALLCATSLFSSALFFAFRNNWIELHIRAATRHLPTLKNISTDKPNKQKISLYYWHNNQLKHEFIECLYSLKNQDRQTVLYEQLINKWLQILDEEDITHVRSTVQTCSLLPNNQELLISFNRSFLPKEWSTYDKLMLIESLFKTLKAAGTSLKHVRFMVQHESMHDDHLDFSRPWPLISFSQDRDYQQAHNSSSNLLNKQRYSIVLDPAGDAQHVGRVLGDTFERAQTLHFAELVKKELESTAGNTQVIIARVPGQVKDSLQTATLANTLHADLYISLNFYQPKEKQELSLYIFYALYDPAEEQIQRPVKQLKSVPYNYAYRSNTRCTKLSKALAEEFYVRLSTNSHSTKFSIQKPIGLPFRSLIAVSQPAFACEIALSSPEQCRTLAKHFAAILKDIFVKS